MGTGTNVQRRLVALHHLDAPWKPAEVEQREGRILRQGNDNEEVAIYRYVTEGSFDAYMWQALETKARFIAQVMTGESAVRRAEDIGGQELSYAEVKAIASGNPAVLTLAEADAELQRLAILKKNHADEQYLARRSIRELPDAIDRLTTRVADLTDRMATLAAHAGDPITIGDQAYAEQDALKPLAKHLNTLPDKVHETRRVPLGTYRGLRFGLVLYPHGAPDAFLEGATTRHAALSRDAHGPRAVLNALDRLAGSYDAQAATARTTSPSPKASSGTIKPAWGSPSPTTPTWPSSPASATSSRPPSPKRPRSGSRARRPGRSRSESRHSRRFMLLRPPPSGPARAAPARPRSRSRPASAGAAPFPRYSPWSSFLRRRRSRPAGRRPIAPGQAAEPTLAESSLPRASSQW